MPALGLSELRELRQLRDENGKLTRLVADLSLDRRILQEIVARKLRSTAMMRSSRVSNARYTSPMHRVAKSHAPCVRRNSRPRRSSRLVRKTDGIGRNRL